MKPDINQILEYIEQIKQQEWLTEGKAWWPDHLFHCTDIVNAIQILNDGKLISRSHLEETKHGYYDIASQSVISGTDTRWLNYVRLYFRPYTPTQYCNEGFRPPGQYRYKSKCPMPVYFIFDSAKILGRKTTLFSKGNLGALIHEVGGDSTFFASIPFEKVYHTGITSEDKSIIHHRCAEVIVPNELDLDCLKIVYCRSQAEFETFINLLSPEQKRRWIRKIGLSNKHKLFEKQWAFIDKVDLSSTEVTFTFNPFSSTYGPFHMILTIEDIFTNNKTQAYNNENFFIGPFLQNGHKISFPVNSNFYRVELFLDNHIAYKNVYNPSPF